MFILVRCMQRNQIKIVLWSSCRVLERVLEKWRIDGKEEKEEGAHKSKVDRIDRIDKIDKSKVDKIDVKK
jgi:hypothetical protein